MKRRIPPRPIIQQCPEGRDDNPASFCHRPHGHWTKHKVLVVCRGWFPSMKVSRGLIDFFRQ